MLHFWVLFMCEFSFFLRHYLELIFSFIITISQNVPPAVLLRFLREHRSEWADSGIDAYSAAAVKAAPCTIPVARTGCVGGQVILPLAHTIENEEVRDHHLSFSLVLLYVFDITYSN